MFGYDWPRLHAALNDLPTALLVAAVFFDLIGTLGRRPSFRQVGFWTLLVGVLGTGLAVLSGLQAEGRIDHGDAVHRVMQTHEKLGLITLGVFAVLALWRIFRETRMGGAERTLSLLLSLAGVGMVVATGAYGGRLVFDHAAGIPSDVLQSELQNRAAGHAHAPGEEHDHGTGEAHEHDGGAPHQHGDSVAQPMSPTNATAPAGHVDPPGTPPHTHGTDGHTQGAGSDGHESSSHSHAPGTPAHQH